MVVIVSNKVQLGDNKKITKEKRRFSRTGKFVKTFWYLLYYLFFSQLFDDYNKITVTFDLGTVKVNKKFAAKLFDEEIKQL